MWCVWLVYEFERRLENRTLWYSTARKDSPPISTRITSSRQGVPFASFLYPLPLAARTSSTVNPLPQGPAVPASIRTSFRCPRKTSPRSVCSTPIWRRLQTLTFSTPARRRRWLATFSRPSSLVWRSQVGLDSPWGHDVTQAKYSHSCLTQPQRVIRSGKYRSEKREEGNDWRGGTLLRTNRARGWRRIEIGRGEGSEDTDRKRSRKKRFCWG